MAGFKAWLGLGYCVRKGERALRILAPVPLRQRTTQDAGADADEEDERPRVTFKATAVFDRSQVDPLPDRRAHGAGGAVRGDERRQATRTCSSRCAPSAPTELGFTVEVRELSGSVGGWCDHAGREIVLDGRVAPNAQSAHADPRERPRPGRHL